MRRTLRLLAGLGALTLLLVPLTGSGAGAGQAQSATALGNAERGRQLYVQACASCHGRDPAGPPAYPTVPALSTVGGAAAVHWAVRTGRMPMEAAQGIAQPGEPRFTEQQALDLAAYVGQAVGDTTLPTANPDAGDLVRGWRLYSQNCGACHGMNGAGSALGGANIAPSLLGVEPRTVAEAMRIGPGPMPVFTRPQFTQHDVDSIAAYVRSLGGGAFEPGGLPIGGKGPVPEGFVAWVIGLGALVLAVYLIGGRNEPQPPPDAHPKDEQP